MIFQLEKGSNEITKLNSTNGKLKEDNKHLKDENKELKREKKLLEEKVRNLKHTVDHYEEMLEQKDNEIDEKENKPVTPVESFNNKMVVLSNCSSRAAALTCRELLPQMGDHRGKISSSELNKLRQSAGIVQMVINAIKFSMCSYIRQIFTDESSIKTFTTICLSVMVEYPNGVSETLELSASDLPKNKSSEAGYNALIRILDEHIEAYEMFLKYCQENDLDTSNFPNPAGISLEKMSDFSLLVSDHANSALKISQLLINKCTELVEDGYPQAELDAMTVEEKNRLCRSIQYGCKAHLRCILQDWSARFEGIVMKRFESNAEESERIEYSTDSLLHAIGKLLYTGLDQYGKGGGVEFKAFVASQNEGYDSELLLSIERLCGSRMDYSYSVALTVCLMKRQIIEYLTYRSNTSLSSESHKLITSIRMRLGSKNFETALIVRARFWIVLYQPLRVLTNKHDLKLNVANMCQVWDTVHDFLERLMEDPSILHQIGLRAFNTGEWPQLIEFYRKTETKEKKTASGSKKSLMAAIRDDVYNNVLGTDEDKNLANDLVYHSADGALQGLKNSGSNVLSSMDGDQSLSTYSEEEVKKSENFHFDNIMSERSFSKVDRSQRTGINFSIATSNSIVTYKSGGGLKEAPECMTEPHQEACIKFAETNLSHFKEMWKQKEIEQMEGCKEKLLEVSEAAAKRSLKIQLSTVSYFFLQRVRDITSAEKLDKILQGISKKGDRLILLKNLINFFYTIWPDTKSPFTSKQNGAIGKETELRSRAKYLIAMRRDRNIPEKPPIEKFTPPAPEDFGLISSDTLKAAQDKYHKSHESILENIMHLHDMYMCNLEFPWISINRPYWDIELTDLQKKFPRGAIFTDDNTNYVSLGLTYDTSKEDYCLYYCIQSNRQLPTESTDDRVEYSFFKTFDTVGINENYDLNQGFVVHEG